MLTCTPLATTCTTTHTTGNGKDMLSKDMLRNDMSRVGCSKLTCCRRTVLSPSKVWKMSWSLRQAPNLLMAAYPWPPQLSRQTDSALAV